MDIIIDEKNEGLTVLSVIKKDTHISTGHLKRLKFTEGGILVNGEHATVRQRLALGDVLSLATEDNGDSSDILPVDLPIDIIYEDGDCIVPAKGADMPTHPSHNHRDDTVANALSYRAKMAGESFVFRPVNRLDRNTSGLLLIAKNRIAAGKLYRSMMNGEIKKAYLAVLLGDLPSDGGEIRTYMKRTEESIILRRVCGENEGGDLALTLYRVVARAGGYTLVAARPVTGRTHQLRVHFANLGSPILGDDLYGEPSAHIRRHALHSAALSFPKPSTDERVTLRAPLPPDMAKAISEIFGNIDEGYAYAICEELIGL